MKKYANHSPHEILTEVAIHGKSEGWSGSIEELRAWETILNKFNVYYVDDFHGTWKRKLAMVDKMMAFADSFPNEAEELSKSMEDHLELLLAKKDHKLCQTFTEICEKYKSLIDTVGQLFKLS